MTHNRRITRAGRGLWRRAAALLVALCVLLALCAAHAETVEAVVEAPGQTVTVTGGLTNDEAAEGYINSILYPNARRPKSANLGAGLTGKEKKLYNILAVKIKAVAAGDLSSTVFDIPVNKVYDQVQFSPEDLNLSTFIDANTNEISAEAVNAFYNTEQLEINTSAVYHALMNDLPYELYWHDKSYRYNNGTETIAATMWGGAGCGWRYSDGSEFLTISEYDSATFSVKFLVAQEYSLAQARGTWDYDVSFGASVKDAVDNAEQIVKANASGSDYEKLVAYKQAICERVKYNDTAAGNSSTPYGNPWQLIWVFDGDANTNVVCEGYSKAFQYLCDLTTFNGNVSAICATGLLGSKGTPATGAGAHMWNIVTMEDGNNYLVDVTNCDGNSIGNPDYLFMKGYKSCAQTTNLTQNDYERLERSGAVEKYSYNCGEDESVQAWYIYDAETLSAFGSTRLALSETAYDPNAAPTEYRKPLTLPNDTTSIKSMAFAYLGVPVNVCLPDNVTYIAPDAFEGSDVLLEYTAATSTADAVEKYLSDFAEKYPDTPPTPTLAYDSINYTP